MGLTRILCYVWTVLSVVEGLNQDTYNYQSSVSKLWPTKANSVAVRSLADCAVLCSSDTDCQGIYYTSTLQKCVLDMNGIFTEYVPDEFTSYYAKEGLGSILPVVSSSSCPLTFTEDFVLQGSSGIRHTYKILQVLVTYDQAVSTCTGLGLHIVKVNNETKILDLSTFFTNCSVYHQDGYWVDARRQVNETNYPWRNSDGGLVADGVWCAGNPGPTLGQDCARMSPANGCGYLLMDKVCHKTYAVICE